MATKRSNERKSLPTNERIFSWQSKNVTALSILKATHSSSSTCLKVNSEHRRRSLAFADAHRCTFIRVHRMRSSIDRAWLLLGLSNRNEEAGMNIPKISLFFSITFALEKQKHIVAFVPLCCCNHGHPKLLSNLLVYLVSECSWTTWEAIHPRWSSSFRLITALLIVLLSLLNGGGYYLYKRKRRDFLHESKRTDDEMPMSDRSSVSTIDQQISKYRPISNSSIISGDDFPSYRQPSEPRLSSAKFSPVSTYEKSDLDLSLEEFQRQALNEHNTMRTMYKKSPLKLSESLNLYAQVRERQMSGFDLTGFVLVLGWAMCSNGCVRFISTRMAIQMQRTNSRRESHRCSCSWSIRWLDQSFPLFSSISLSLCVQVVISLRWSWPREIIPWKWIVFWMNWVQKSGLVERRFQRRTAMSKSNNGLVSLIIIPIVNYRQFNLRQRKRHKWTQPSVSKQRMKDRWTYIEFISSVAIRQTCVRVCFVSQREREGGSRLLLTSFCHWWCSMSLQVRKIDTKSLIRYRSIYLLR